VSTPIPNFYSRTREDLVSHPIDCKPKEDKLNSSWSSSNGFENLAASFNSDLSFKDESSPSTPEPAPVTNAEQFTPPQINVSKLDNAEVIDKCGSENESEETVQVKPWQDESKLDESVLEDCSNIDITRVLKDLKNFINEPVRKGGTMRCTITREKKGLEKSWYPEYYLHWEKEADQRFFLLAARRRKKCVTGSYLISVDPIKMSKDCKSFVGKVRANAVGTFFTVYDNGCNPKKAENLGDGLRQELAAIIYEKNVFGWNGPRKMTILIPGMHGEGASQRREIRPISEKDSMIERFKAGKNEEMIVLHNKPPMWSEETQSFVLNFRGRVTQASVKNFQIIHEGNRKIFKIKELCFILKSC